MAGVANACTMNGATSAEECVKLCTDASSKPGVKYARLFAEADGRGLKEEQAFAEVSEAYGADQASSLRAMCWFLYWGSYTGNTLNATLGFKSKKKGVSRFFEYTFLAYYGLLFYGLIGLVSLMIKIAPRVPNWFSAVFGVILATCAGSHFVPLGLLSYALSLAEGGAKEKHSA
mmetsp:Transcript_339/g.1064  ORF Transcript_339/g.1064 Transcript_339/m.1064 type:complete len:174 (-) Transcript_339:384-905(-)|eukprot:scaffold150054_cov36-Tisochrysis_lutea.AAC.1